MANTASTRKVTTEDVQAATLSLEFRRQLRFWLIAVVIFAGFLWLFSDILLPFAAGIVLAYFLDPVADWLERRGLSRTWATVVILLTFIILVVIALMIVVPLVATQLADLVSKLPDYLARLQSTIADFNPQWLEQRFGINPDSLRNSLNSALSSGISIASTVFGSIVSSASSIMSLFGLLVVTPVVAFYMLLDWDHMVEKVDSWVPRQHVQTVRGLARDINASTAGFVRGQGTVCLILGILYSAGLMLVGLNFAVLVGMTAGLISFVPYVGSLVGLVTALGLAFVQFWPEWQPIAATTAVFAVGQFIEGNFLQPRLVGKSVGLHPVWLMFALFAFGALFGFVGLLIAVPAAAAIGVLVRYAIDRYLDSPLYTGEGNELVEVVKVDVIGDRAIRTQATEVTIPTGASAKAASAKKAGKTPAKAESGAPAKVSPRASKAK